MRAYYSEFVNHCIRFYVRYPQPRFHSDTDKKNWNACDNALKSFNDADKKTIFDIYNNGDDFLTESIACVAKARQCKPGAIWKLIEDFERRVAKKRGLL